MVYGVLADLASMVLRVGYYSYMFHEGVAPALLLCVFHFPLNKLRRLFIHI
jgi:hypothetical protein